MNSTLQVPVGFNQLSLPAQLAYLEWLWDLTEIGPEEDENPDWLLELIRERLEEHRRNPQAGRPWEEVLAEMKARSDRGE